MRQTLIDMGWPHPPTPIQTNNYSASVVVNDTTVARKTKSMELRLHWLRSRESQQQFFFTGSLESTIGPTTAPSTTHQFTTRSSTPYLQARLRNCTKPL